MPESPTIEVRVYRHGERWQTELCDTEEEAAEVVARWSEVDGVRCEVDDLTVHHEPGQVFEPEPALLDEDDEEYDEHAVEPGLEPDAGT